MKLQELRYVEKSLEDLGCPFSQSTTNALQIVSDLQKSGTDILTTTFSLDEKNVLIITPNKK